jgi:ankyrin repeat protein
MEEIIKELLAAGANVDKRGRIGSMWFTPLAVAARMGLVRVVELLLKNNADVHAHGRRILHLVARWGLHDRAGVFKVLLNHGADVHAKDGRGYTPLHSAVHGSSEARLLIHYGADVLARNNFGDTAEFMATRSGVHRVVELIQTEPARMEALRRAKCEAFAMGQLERLGAVSRVRALDPGVVRMVLDHL